MIKLNIIFYDYIGDYWDNGDKFNPERFLDDSGNVVKHEQFIPFSVGKRQCLGETLARAELFLFFSNLLQQYKFSPEIEGVLPKEEWSFGFTTLPKPFKVRLSHRF